MPEARALPRTRDRTVRVGRRVFLGIIGLGALGVAIGSRVQSAVSDALGSGLGGLVPGGNRFRIYTITGSFPSISDGDYRLRVEGLVERPTTFTLDDLKSMPQTALTRNFQCVTGWVVSDVHWQGVRLSDILAAVGVKHRATALTFDSYDGADTESLTLAQAARPDVIVAHSMLGAPVTREHGGPVRLYVAPMYGYKSIKWLSTIRVVDQLVPGFWEENGYPVDAWLPGDGPTT